MRRPTANLDQHATYMRGGNECNAPISPNRPRIEPKTSTMRMRTNRLGSAASEMAAVEPVMPTVIPQNRLQSPTVRPPQNRP
jgi:hypothetical protein